MSFSDSDSERAKSAPRARGWRSSYDDMMAREDLVFSELNSFPRKEVIYFADKLSQSISLKRFSLTCKPSMIPYVSSALERNTSLKSFALHGSFGAKEAELLCTSLAKNRSLTSVKLAGCSFGPQSAMPFAELIQHGSRNLVKLDLGDNNLGDTGTKFVADAIKGNSTLSRFVFAENSMGTEGSLYLSDALSHNTTLTRLFLQNNELDAQGILHLATVLRTNTTLQTLDVRGNALGVEGACHIADALKVNVGLESLLLGNLELEGEAILYDCLRANVTLSRIKVEDGPVIRKHKPHEPPGGESPMRGPPTLAPLRTRSPRTPESIPLGSPGVLSAFAGDFGTSRDAIVLAILQEVEETTELREMLLRSINTKGFSREQIRAAKALLSRPPEILIGLSAVCARTEGADIVDLISTLASNENFDLTRVDEVGHTLLHVACGACLERVALTLIDHGAASQVDQPNVNGCTPVHLAAGAGLLSVVKALHAFGHSISIYDATGKAPIHHAIDRGRLDVVAWLIRKGARGLSSGQAAVIELLLGEDGRTTEKTPHDIPAISPRFTPRRPLPIGPGSAVQEAERPEWSPDPGSPRRAIVPIAPVLSPLDTPSSTTNLRRPLPSPPATTPSSVRPTLHRSLSMSSVGSGRYPGVSHKRNAATAFTQSILDALRQGHVPLAALLLVKLPGGVFSARNMTAAEIEVLGGAFSHCAGSGGGGENHGVAELELTACDLRGKAGEMLVDGLRRCDLVRSLRVCRCQVDMEDTPFGFVERLCSLLAAESTIKILHVNDCALTSRHGCLLAAAIRLNSTLPRGSALIPPYLDELQIHDNGFTSLHTVRDLMSAVQLSPRLLKDDFQRDIPIQTVFGGTGYSWSVARAHLTYLLFGVLVMVAGVSTSIGEAVVQWRAREDKSLKLRIDLSAGMSHTRFGMLAVSIAATVYFAAATLPWAIPWFAMSSGGSASASAWSVAGFLLCLFLWVLLILVCAHRDTHNAFGKMEDDATSVRWLQKGFCCRASVFPNWRNVLAVAAVVLESVQMASLSFLPNDAVYPESANAGGVLLLSILDFKRTAVSFRVVFYVCVAVGVLWWILASYLAVNALEGNLAAALSAFPAAEFVSFILSNTMFITVTRNLLLALDCTYQDAGGTLDALPELPCWGPEHAGLSTLAMYILWIYVFSAVFVGPNFQRDHSGLADVQFAAVFSLEERGVKLLAIVFVEFLSSYPLTSLGILVVANLGLSIASYVMQPCSVVWVSNLKALMYGLSGWSVVVNLCATAIGSTKSWGAMSALVIGWVLIVVSAVVLPRVWRRWHPGEV